MPTEFVYSLIPFLSCSVVIDLLLKELSILPEIIPTREEGDADHKVNSDLVG